MQSSRHFALTDRFVRGARAFSKSPETILDRINNEVSNVVERSDGKSTKGHNATYQLPINPTEAVRGFD